MQPPPRDCVLKQNKVTEIDGKLTQPPPRDCVLKHQCRLNLLLYKSAAASARLCVETNYKSCYYGLEIAAAFARLCVETTQSAYARCCG